MFDFRRLRMKIWVEDRRQLHEFKTSKRMCCISFDLAFLSANFVIFNILVRISCGFDLESSNIVRQFVESLDSGERDKRLEMSSFT